MGHSRRILHRDVKARNVFPAADGVAKLGDFGVSKVLEHTGHRAMTLIGTPYYLPPEMYASKPYGFPADIWCLGVSLHELLTFEPPFSALNLAALALRICTQEPAAINGYSKALCRLGRRLLHKQPF